MAAATPAVRAVARIAQLASDQLLATAPFAAALDARSARPVHLLNPSADHADALLAAHRTPSLALASYLAPAQPAALHRLLPHLSELSATPTVLHVALADGEDLSDVLVLRAAVPVCLYSRSAQQAHDHALLASRLARSERRTVLHIFHASADDAELVEVDPDAVQPYLLADAPKSPRGTVPAKKEDAASLYAAYESAALSTVSLVRRPLRAFAPAPASSSTPTTVLLTIGPSLPLAHPIPGVSAVELSLLKPLPPAVLARAVPPGAESVLVCEAVGRWRAKWPPLFLEVLAALQDREPRPAVRSVRLGDVRALAHEDVIQLLERAAFAPQTERLVLGHPASAPNGEPKQAAVPTIPKHESTYTTLLGTLFGDRLDLANAPERVAELGALATSPEFTLGRIRGELDAVKRLEDDVKALLSEADVPQDLHALLGEWLLLRSKSTSTKKTAQEAALALAGSIIAALDDSAGTLKGTAGRRVFDARHVFRTAASSPSRSTWIVGSDAWAHDLGASGLHHAIASRLNINVLLLDTTPYPAPPHAPRRRDAGLYAMNHGDVYVASVALYAGYAQVLQALLEADAFAGPALVLAYLPLPPGAQQESVPALDVLKATKRAVDAGAWPLYRWNPARADEARFALDSDAVRNDLQRFLDRANHLSQLVRAAPQLPAELVGSLGERLRKARRAKAQQAYADLLTAIDAPPVAVLYASDGGTAEKVAKRLAARAKLRGLACSAAPMDSVTLEDLAKEDWAVFVTSVAGQGELPQNARALAKALSAAAARGERPLENVKFSVFGMGDSHYWPRPEDAHYYNKAGKDLDARLESLGAARAVPLGLGDDQDADGPETGYKAWEPLLWKALGVDAVEVTEKEPEAITNEHIKVASGYLRGTIKEGLEDTSTGALAPSDTQLTKFHGIYQQDDRDIRDERVAQGVEPAYSFMIRVRMPGGVCRPDQYMIMDRIADEHGCGTFKITTRQTFQFHGVIKRHLKSAIQDINRALLDTLAACGDVNRNVLVSAIPPLTKLHAQANAFAARVSDHLLPRTSAYHEIWLDKKLVAGDAIKDVEPLYGEFYLPRKFKIAVAVPPTNDVDVFANDVGFIAIVGDDGELAGFNVTVGGGMGVTHGNKKTYPRLGDVFGFCTVEQGVDVAEKIMLVQKDNGNREDRKNARLKYTIDRMGLDNFKAEVERRLGFKLAPARPFTFNRNVDDFGWHTGEDGKHHFTMFIENGRVQDEPGREFKTGLREIAKVHKGAFRMTANQHLLITDIADEDLPQIKELLAKYKLDNLEHTGLRLSSSACVAFPTCGLAMAESERYLPILIDKVEKICEENGLRNDSIVMRMTGCPNGCARPYVAEVAFVGKAPGTYAMLLGGGYHGQRLNKIYRETVTEPEILAILRPMIKRYALERHEGEHFGDFVIRAGYIAPTTEGKAWYDRMGGEGQYREIAV